MKTYWWEIILFVIFSVIAAYVLYGRLIRWLLDEGIRSLDEEEASIGSLREEQQKKHALGLVSYGEYRRIIAQYDSRLNVIRQLRARMRNRRAGIIRTEQEIQNLEHEKRSPMYNPS